VDFAQLVKLYGAAPEAFKGRYSPAEPETWAMMLVGLGGLGAALRTRPRQRRAVVTA
jgi:hypothetical protein